MQVKIITIVIGAFGTVTKGLLEGLEDLEVGERVETIQTTALLRTTRIQSPGHFGRLAVTQAPVKDRKLKLMWKNYKLAIIVIIKKGFNFNFKRKSSKTF